MAVKSLIAKTKTLPDKTDVLGEDENPFSTNKVTGHSLNFPIIGTCSPTEVCAETCYFAKGPSTWTASLKKQHRLLNAMNADPGALAKQIVAWAVRLRLTFVRWNGGGDLTERAPECIDAVATAISGVPQWVVTRKPEIAALITPRPNVFVHFSVDKGSWSRLEEFTPPAGLNWFWSYQCDSGEEPTGVIAPVVFRDKYDPAGTQPHPGDCPLNWREDISGACESCRRCFSGEAVTAAASMDWRAA